MRTERKTDFDAVIKFCSITFSCHQFRIHRDINALMDQLSGQLFSEMQI